MARKTRENIAKWVAKAVSTALDTDGNEVIAEYVANAGDYQRVSVKAAGAPIEEDEFYAATVDDRTIRFQLLEDRGNDEYLLRVRID